MELSNINEFLDSYRKRLFGREDHRSRIIATIQKISGVTVAEKDIQIKRHEVVLSVDSVTKNQLFLYKEKIIEELQKTGIKDVLDLR